MQLVSQTMVLARRIAGALLLILLAFLPLTAQESAPVQVIIVDSSKFDDRKTGIKKLANAYHAVESEVASVRAKIVFLQQRYSDLEKKIQSENPAASCDDCAKSTKDADKLKKEIEESLIQGRKIYQERLKKVVDPVFEEIEAALKDYSGTKKNVFIYDIAKDSSSFIFCGAPRAEITEDFIEYFNNRYP